MTTNSIQTAFSAGELSPSLFGRTDLAKYHLAASTMRNFFVNYRGGASSRAGNKYVLACKQPATASDDTPPRNIPFQFNINQGYVLEFGDEYMRIVSNGAYIVEDPTNITAATNADPIVITDMGHGLEDDDWVYINEMEGMTELNGLPWIITNKTTDTYELTDLFGNVVDSTDFGIYTSGGGAERIYTVDSPYSVEDLPFLKYTQSADTMSLCCLNQDTGDDYAAYDLVRNAATDWEFIEATFESSQDAPTSPTATPHASTTLSTYYSYVVTAVNEAGEESVASIVATCQNNDISVNAGSNVIAWSAPSGAASYNIYGATPVYGITTPSGVPFGYMGSTTGLSFVDTNIIADFTQTPPINTDPFPSTGDYPSVPAYFQQRRVYANTLNNPDTYYFSRPGAYLNMDVSIPLIDSDAIVGTPWAQQINGIQFMIPMTTGLITLTGNGAWLVNGGSNGAITPSSQTATAQAYNGCNNHVQPIVANYDILYVQAKGSIVRDLSYSFDQNIFTGQDKTILSNHLFNFHQIQQWCYAEEPYKIIWAVRDDGIMLSMTYLKEQDVYGWARHDTNGLFVNCCSVTEPPVDAVYTIVKRYIVGEDKWMYYQERMDNRNWQNVEDCFCVDAGLSYPMTFPNSTLIPESATGTNNISAVNLILGGSGYTAPVATITDPTGQGSGATFSITLSSGVITAITPIAEGEDYQPGSTMNIADSTGSGAKAQPIITNNVTFTTSSSVFNSGMVGDVIRIGNNNAPTTGFAITASGAGKAVVTSYVSGTEIVADIIEPITNTMPNDPNDMPIPAAPNQWSISTPTTTVGGLNHLEGMEVAILADGSVVANQIVTDGAIELPSAASAITIGLPYTCQLQTLYLDPPNTPTTVQGKRKNIQAVTVRMEASRGMSVGTNQLDQSTLPNNADVPWVNMKPFKERTALISAGSPIPLFTGDERILVPGDWKKPGQVAVETSFPLPANVIAVLPEWVIGDSNG